MEAHGEGIVVGGAMRALFGIAAREQQAEIGGLVSVARRLAAAGVDDFRQHQPAHFHAPLSCSVELSSLQRIAHGFPPPQIYTVVWTDESANMLLYSSIRGWTKCGIGVFFRFTESVCQADADQYQCAASDLIAGQ